MYAFNRRPIAYIRLFGGSKDTQSLNLIPDRWNLLKVNSGIMKLQTKIIWEFNGWHSQPQQPHSRFKWNTALIYIPIWKKSSETGMFIKIANLIGFKVILTSIYIKTWKIVTSFQCAEQSISYISLKICKYIFISLKYWSKISVHSDH